jgi:hypothetical protein
MAPRTITAARKIVTSTVSQSTRTARTQDFTMPDPSIMLP